MKLLATFLLAVVLALGLAWDIVHRLAATAQRPVAMSQRVTGGAALDMRLPPAARQMAFTARDVPPPVTMPSSSLTIQQLAALALLNEARRSAGVGELAEDARLTAAAADHAAYLRRYGERSHVQQAQRAGFTGSSVADRVARHRYPAADGGVDENFVVEVRSAGECVGWLVATVYHLGVVVAPQWRDVGVSFDGSVCVLVFAHGVDGAAPLPEPGRLVLYPAHGRSDVAARFRPASELPDPAPDLGLAGQPVLAGLADRNDPQARSVVLDGFALTADAGGATVVARLLVPAGLQVNERLTHQVDGRLRGDQVFLLPVAPLASGAGYTAAISGRIGGVPFERRWSFRTAGS